MAHAKASEAISINISAKARQREPIDQAVFTPDAGTFAKFQALLDRPLPATDKVRRLLKTKAPWEA